MVDIPTRAGVTQRVLQITPDTPRAAVVLFPGGDGGLRISAKGDFEWGAGNFLVRSRLMFAEHGLAVTVVDAPSDRQGPPYLTGFRQTSEHAADIRAVIAWLKQRAAVPVWLVGTSRGTQSAAAVAIRLANEGGPDGLVLTATVLTDDRGRPVPEMNLGKLRVPTLIVHHREDGCSHCDPRDLPRLLNKLTSVVRKELLLFEGGRSRGDPCDAFAHHGFNGLERDVVAQIAAWILAR